MTSKSINANVLTSTGKLDSLAAPDGSPKMTVIRSDQFVTGINGGFYTASGAGTEWCTPFSGALDGKTLNAVDVRFNAGATPNAKLAIGLPQKYTELWFEFDLFVPANFLRSGNANNKFFRLWGDAYGDIDTLLGQKVGASMWGSDVNSGYAKLTCDVSAPVDGSSGSTGPRGTSDQTFIAPADCGHWMHISIYAKAPTLGGNINADVGNGIIRISKNGVVAAESLTVPNMGNAYLGYKNAYILGWPNSPYVNETHFYIANLVIRGE